MTDNNGKVALVFGVRNESSIAWHIAKALYDSGCYLAITYLPDTKTDVLALLQAYNMNAITCEVDVRKEHEIEHCMETLKEQFGKIDYLLHGVAFANYKVMCARAPGSKDEVPSFLDIPFDDLMDSFNISAYSLLRIARVSAPYLAANASILTLTYNASKRVFPGYAGMSINKAALENIMIYLSHFFGSRDIRVNALSAGLVMTTSAGGIKGVRQLRKIGKYSAPLGNITAEDVANAAMYYFCPLSKKVTGNIHFVDGGFNIMGVTNDE